MVGLHARCVVDAPNMAYREALFDALETYTQLVRMLIPTGSLWIDGGFVTQKAIRPTDVDVVVCPSEWAIVEAFSEDDWTKFYGLMTLQDVIVGSVPIYVPRIQPFGGALDGFLCYPGLESYWDGLWTRVTDQNKVEIPGKKKGYAEVIL